jgi:hypothetical protein
MLSLCLIIFLQKHPRPHTHTHTHTRSRGGQGRSSRGRSDSRGGGRAGGNHSSRAALTSEQKKIMSTVSAVKPNWSNNEVFRFCNKNGVCPCARVCVRVWMYVGLFHPHTRRSTSLHPLTHSLIHSFTQASNRRTSLKPFKASLIPRTSGRRNSGTASLSSRRRYAACIDRVFA